MLVHLGPIVIRWHLSRLIKCHYHNLTHSIKLSPRPLCNFGRFLTSIARQLHQQLQYEPLNLSLQNEPKV